MMRKIATLILALLWVAPASAQIIGTLPFNLQNGTIADANQVMSDLNAIVAAVNANAANAGANSNITALNGLTTPLVYTSGGTSSYIGGTSSGSANAQVIASPIPAGFTAVTGKSITFVAGFTNTGPMTLNVNSTGAGVVLKQSPTGPVALSGGEVVAGNVVTAVLDNSNNYQLSNPAPLGTVLPCTTIDWVGASPPLGYIIEGGQAISRTAFSTLFGCITVQGVSATTTNSNPTVAVPNSALFQVGWFVGGNNVTCNSVILNIPNGSSITLNNNAGAGGATTLTIGPYQQGDCSSTFNLPNLSGRITTMRDTTGTVLTSATCGNPASQGSNCGAQNQTLTLAQLPTGLTVTGAISVASNGSFPIGQNNTTTMSDFTPSGSGARAFSGATAFAGTVTSTGTANLTSNNTSGAAHPILPPVALVDKYIKF